MRDKAAWKPKEDPRAAYISARELDRGYTKGTHHLVSTNGLPLCASNSPCIENIYGGLFKVLPGTHCLTDYLLIRHVPAKATVCKNCASLAEYGKMDKRGRFSRFVDSHVKSLIIGKWGFICDCGRRVQKGDKIFYYWATKKAECVVCGDDNKDIAV